MQNAFADALQTAVLELSKTQKLSQEFQESSMQKKAELSKQIFALRHELSTEKSCLKKELASMQSSDALTLESQAYKQKISDIIKILTANQNIVNRQKKDIYTLSNSALLDAIKDNLNKTHSLVFEPLKIQKINFEFMDGKNLKKSFTGSFFRVGPMGYFVSEDNSTAFNLIGFTDLKIDKIFGQKDAHQIIAFLKNSANELPFDENFGKENSASISDMGFLEKFKAGGIWMWPIMGFGVLALVVSIYKCFQIFSIRKASPNLVIEICSNIDSNNLAKAENLARREPDIYSAMLKELIENHSAEKNIQEEITYEYMLVSGEKIYRMLGFISITAAISPLLGLLGTVSGIIKTFGNLSMGGAGNASMLSEGIGEALITTEYGLMIAIPSLVIHAFLTKRAKSIMSEMEKIASGFLGYSFKIKN